MKTKIKNIFEEFGKAIIGFIIFICIYNIELPYYIETSGGILNLEDRIEIAGAYKSEGSFNMTYVSELKANIFSFLLAKIDKEYDLIKKESVVNSNETEEEMIFRSKLMLEEANNNAIILAYKKANKEVKVKSNKLYVTYIDELANTDLKIGDEIVAIDGININCKNDINKIISSKNKGDTIKITVLNNDEKKEKTATLINYEGNILIGIMSSEKKEIETEQDIKLKFKKSESGSSGGLMTSLAIYNYLTEEDITLGLKISGTGTIDENGNVGEISGIKYKLRGAVKEKSDLFIAPLGENYEEALYEKEKNNYDIDIIGVKTFDEVLEYLQKEKD